MKKKNRARLAACGVVLQCAACSSDEQSAARDEVQALSPVCEASSEALPALQLTEIVTGLDLPTFLAAVPGDDRLLVLEQEGRIRVVQDGALQGQDFADLSDRVHTRLPAYSEWGLLGLAFHPDFESNGRVFIHYSSVAMVGVSVGDESVDISEGDGVVSEFALDSNGNLDSGSERRLLVVPQPELNHNGGSIEFSPEDGFLYIGLGDGGGQGDPNGNGQNLQSLLGKVLRIDVDGAAPYATPPGNMTGADVAPEIWSYGFRNPWRFSFDPCNGDLYVGDVGQNLLEEIDVEPAGQGGRNYGWNIKESSSCFNDTPDDPNAERFSFTNPLDNCSEAGLAPPVVEYGRGWGCSLTGGYVYRGSAIPGLQGRYLYADYCTGNIGSFRYSAGAASDEVDLTDDLNPNAIISFSSFGVDQAGELYLLSHSGGAFPEFVGDAGVLYKIEPE